MEKEIDVNDKFLSEMKSEKKAKKETKKAVSGAETAPLILSKFKKNRRVPISIGFDEDTYERLTKSLNNERQHGGNKTLTQSAYLETIIKMFLDGDLILADKD